MDSRTRRPLSPTSFLPSLVPVSPDRYLRAQAPVSKVQFGGAPLAQKTRSRHNTMGLARLQIEGRQDRFSKALGA